MIATTWPLLLGHGRPDAGRRPSGHASWSPCHPRRISDAGYRRHHVLLLRRVPARYIRRTATGAQCRPYSGLCSSRCCCFGSDPRPGFLRPPNSLGNHALSVGRVLCWYLCGGRELAQRQSKPFQSWNTSCPVHARSLYRAGLRAVSAGPGESQYPDVVHARLGADLAGDGSHRRVRAPDSPDHGSA